MASVVTLDRVTVRYGRQQALRDVSATFPLDPEFIRELRA